MHSQEPVLVNESHKLLGDFLNTNGSLNLGQMTRPNKSQPKRGIFRLVDFGVSTDHRIKLEENKKKDKCLHLVRELTKKLDHEMMVIPVVIYVLVTVTRGLVQKLEDLEIRGTVVRSNLLPVVGMSHLTLYFAPLL